MATGFRDFNLTFGSKVAGLLISVAGQGCLAWVLGPSDRGSYAVCVIYETLLAVIFMVGCELAGVVFVSSGRLSLSEGITNSFILILAGSLLAVIAGCWY